MWYNKVIVGMLRSPFHRLISSGVMLVTYTGRKSGKTFRVPVTYVPYEGDLLTVSFKHRVWWRNLRGVDQIELTVRGKKVYYRPIVHEDNAAVAEQLRHYLVPRPNYVRFFDITLDEDGQLNEAQLNLAAEKRVMIQFVPPENV